MAFWEIGEWWKVCADTNHSLSKAKSCAATNHSLSKVKNLCRNKPFRFAPFSMDSSPYPFHAQVMQRSKRKGPLNQISTFNSKSAQVFHPCSKTLTVQRNEKNIFHPSYLQWKRSKLNNGSSFKKKVKVEKHFSFQLSFPDGSHSRPQLHSSPSLLCS